jgi:dTDP-4-amino-4,6-dideoxygalactose transaminase
MADAINNKRLSIWNQYYIALKHLENKGNIELPFIPDYCEHNAHMFYIKLKDINERQKLIHYLKGNEVQAVFHYIPLHSSPAGVKFGRFNKNDINTTKESERLLRLPIYYNISEETVEHVIDLVNKFFNK